MSPADPDATSNQRVRRGRNRSGWIAEWAVVVYMTLKGYRLIARRYKTHVGEVDLIMARNRRVAFIEVKYRQTLALCEAAITPNLRQRVRRSANLWLAKHTRYHGYDVGFDLVLLCPWRWPHHIENGL